MLELSERGRSVKAKRAEAFTGCVVFALLASPCLLGASAFDDVSTITVFILAGVAFVSGAYDSAISSASVRRFLVFMVALAFVQIVDCFAASELSAIRYMVFTMGIAVFTVAYCMGYLRLSHDFVIAFSCVAIFGCVSKSVLGISSLYHDNTTSGIMVFVYIAGLFSFLASRSDADKSLVVFDWRILAVLASGVMLFVGLGISKARTALLVFLIVCFVFLVLRSLLKKGKRKTALQYCYFLIIALLLAAVLFYANITQFEWYDELNYYSQLLVGKNIDSSRGDIWGQGFSDVESNLLFGAGADKLPTGRFEGLSYHSSFVQVLVQNGLVGLMLLVGALYCLWSMLSRGSDDRAVCFALAAFVGILIYNCFECTLLSNKVALGLTQWFVLAIACNRVLDLRLVEQGG